MRPRFATFEVLAVVALDRAPWLTNRTLTVRAASRDHAAEVAQKRAKIVGFNSIRPLEEVAP